MIQAGTPCPIDGKIGKDALALWTKYDFESLTTRNIFQKMEKERRNRT